VLAASSNFVLENRPAGSYHPHSAAASVAAARETGKARSRELNKRTHRLRQVPLAKGFVDEEHDRTSPIFPPSGGRTIGRQIAPALLARIRSVVSL
jgi:hypothetical protein